MDKIDVKINLTIYLLTGILTIFWPKGIYLLLGMIASTMVKVWKEA